MENQLTAVEEAVAAPNADSDNEGSGSSKENSSRDQTYDNGHGTHNECTPFFVPMSQMQRWGDKQKALHTEWGNIFFDLFYVAAAYNLGNLLREDMSMRGILYLVALFFPIMNWWMYRMNFMSRFKIPKDVFHTTFMTLQLLPLATAVHYIRTVPVLSDPRHHKDMFNFCLSLSIGHVLYAYALSEIMYCQRKVKSANLFPEAFHTCKQLLLVSLPPALCSIAAAIYTGIEYFVKNDTQDKIGGRKLADVFDDGPMNDVAAWLLVGGIAVNIVSMSLLVFGRGIVYGRSSDYNPQEYSVPLNIDFAIHRYGEWIMLLLGESVLSLLIVDLSDGPEYYAIFFSGIVTVVFLEYLHFRSQPHEPDHHAFRRSRGGAFVFYYFMQVYSISLITLGASYKYFLWEAVFASENDTDQRRALFPMFERLLASATTSLRFDTDDRQQRIANIFSGSLALVWLCMDVISVSHKGASASWSRLNKCPKGMAAASLLVIMRASLVVFAATLSMFVTEPVTLAFTGLLGIFAQLCLRFAGTVVFPPTEEEAEDEAIDKAVNFAKARVRESERERDGTQE